MKTKRLFEGLRYCLILHSAFFILHCHAALQRSWQVDAGAGCFADLKPVFHGEELTLRADFVDSNGRPFALPEGDWKLYFQTNGMDSLYYGPFPATASSNSVSAVFSPTNDPGAAQITGYLSLPGFIYHAAFRLRFLPSPGATPNAIPLPVQRLDFDAIEIANAPWPAEIAAATNALAAATAAHKWPWSSITNAPVSWAWSAITGKPTTWAWSAITGKPTTWAWSAISGKPSWIGDTKPGYSASEVGALPAVDWGAGEYAITNHIIMNNTYLGLYGSSPFAGAIFYYPYDASSTNEWVMDMGIDYESSIGYGNDPIPGSYDFRTYLQFRTGIYPDEIVSKLYPDGTDVATHQAITNAIADAAAEVVARFDDVFDAIADAAPADYANVSNLAYSALQSETDPTIKAWAKAASKPSYTAQEVGAAPASLSTTVTTINGKVAALETWSVGDDTQLRVEQAGQTNATLAVLYTNKVMYASAVAESNTLAKAEATTVAHITALAEAIDATKADKSWGDYTSGGAPSPADTLIIEKEKVAVTGGGNFSYIESSTGGYWVMAVSLGSRWTLSSLADAQNPNNPSSITLYDGNGNAVQTVTSTATREAYAVSGEQYIYCDSSGANDVITLVYPVVADIAPTIEFAPTPDSAFAAADQYPAYVGSVVASGASGMWTNTVTMVGHPGQGFFKGKYVKAGSSYTAFDKPIGLSEIVIDGTNYTMHVEVINGKKHIILD